MPSLLSAPRPTSDRKPIRRCPIAGAVADYTAVIALRPVSSDVYALRAMAQLDLGELDAAIADSTKVIELSLAPKDGGAHSTRATTRQRPGDLVGALADYTQAIACEPRNPLFHYFRADTKKNPSDLRGALPDYDRAAELDPNDWANLVDRGYVRGGPKAFFAALERSGRG